MLRKRSRPAVNASNATTTTSIIISGGNSTTPTTVFPHPEKTSKPTLPSSLLFFNPTIMSSPKDSNQSVVSPSSVLDSVSSSSSRLLDKRFFFSNPFITSFTENKQSTQPQQQHPHSWDKSGISVVLIDSSSSSFLKPNHTSNSTTTPWPSTNNSSKLVVFGSHQLRIQIPSSQPTSQLLNPNSPVEFGIKTPRSNLTPNFDKRTTGMEKDSPNQMRKSFSMEEMELSEDYTCVISRGPNPKTTHIFGNRVVECSSCGGGSRSRVWEMKRDEFGLEQEGGSGCLDCVVSSSFSSEEECCYEDLGGARSGGKGGSFLSHCCLCKKTLGDENDIYMYRGEKAFCSQECRDQGMLLFDGNQS